MLQRFLGRVLPEEVMEAVEPHLERMGDLAAGRLLELSQEHRLDEPRLVPSIPGAGASTRSSCSPAWREFARVAAEEGLVATAYERRHGAVSSRLHQFALVYLFTARPMYTCPLAMTDGAARTLLDCTAPSSLRARRCRA